MNRGLAVSADTMRWPSLRATSLSGGNCSLRFTSADCAPAVERPSSHAQLSMMRRKSATSSFVSTLGTQISIASQSKSRRDHQRRGAARRFQHERRRTLIQRVVIELVEDVVDEQLQRPVLVDLRLCEGIEAPEAWQRRALVRGKQGAAVNLRTIDSLAADLPPAVDLIFAEQTERLICDVGQRQADIGRVKKGGGRRDNRIDPPRLYHDEHT